MPIKNDRRAIDMPREVLKKDLIISKNYYVCKRNGVPVRRKTFKL
jgi:hypothetical protein